MSLTEEFLVTASKFRRAVLQMNIFREQLTGIDRELQYVSGSVPSIDSIGSSITVVASVVIIGLVPLKGG
jgi:hypothetical protein